MGRLSQEYGKLKSKIKKKKFPVANSGSQRGGCQRRGKSDSKDGSLGIHFPGGKKGIKKTLKRMASVQKTEKRKKGNAPRRTRTTKPLTIHGYKKRKKEKVQRAIGGAGGGYGPKGAWDDPEVG